MRSFAHNLVEGQVPHYNFCCYILWILTSCHHPLSPPSVVEANCMQLNAVESENLDLLTNSNTIKKKFLLHNNNNFFLFLTLTLPTFATPFFACQESHKNCCYFIVLCVLKRRGGCEWKRFMGILVSSNTILVAAVLHSCSWKVKHVV